VILLDTDGLFNGLDASAERHQQVRQFLEQSDDPLILSPFVLAELDYFLRDRLGRYAEDALLSEVATGAYELQLFDNRDVAEAHAIIEQHDRLGISLADASIVVLARRFDVRRVLTFDRHFRALKPAGPGSFFTLVPTDEA
jgi:predicted nucleic acid-binding protein